jgi:hypothetical protein
MTRTLSTLMAAAAIAAVTATAPAPAQARCFGCAVGVGVLGGALLGAAVANSYPRAYAPVPGYAPYPAYAGPAPYSCPGGYWARRPLLDPYGRVVGYSRPRFFCG